MPTVVTQVEYLSFDAVAALDAVPTGTPAWKGLDYSSFYLMGPRVGENRPVPGATGRLAVTREIDELKVSLRMRFNGRRDRENTAITDPFEGVIDNILYFRKHVLDYIPARAVTFHRRDGSTAAGTVIIDGWETAPDPASDGSVHLLVASLTIPAGSLVTPA